MTKASCSPSATASSSIAAPGIRSAQGSPTTRRSICSGPTRSTNFACNARVAVNQQGAECALSRCRPPRSRASPWSAASTSIAARPGTRPGGGAAPQHDPGSANAVSASACPIATASRSSTTAEIFRRSCERRWTPSAALDAFRTRQRAARRGEALSRPRPRLLRRGHRRRPLRERDSSASTRQARST